MSVTHYSTGSIFEEKIGYSRAVKKDNWLFISGTTGYNYNTMEIDEHVHVQAKQCFVNIEKVLEEAGFVWKDVVRVNYILKNAEEFKLCWDVCQEYLGEVRPAATMIEANMANPEIKIEVEITALRG